MCSVPQYHSDSSNPSFGINHRAAFKKYVTLQTRQRNINTFDEFKNMFAMMLTDIT